MLLEQRPDVRARVHRHPAKPHQAIAAGEPGVRAEALDAPVALRVGDSERALRAAEVVALHGPARLEREHEVHEALRPAERVRLAEHVGVLALAEARARDGEAAPAVGRLEGDRELRAVAQRATRLLPAQQPERLRVEHLGLEVRVRIRPRSRGGRAPFGGLLGEGAPDALDRNTHLERALPLRHDGLSSTSGWTASTTR